LVKYLSFVRNAYDANPEPRQLTREEIQSAFELTDEEAELLGKLVFFDNSFPFAGGGALGKEWRAQLPREAEDIPEDVRGYLHAKLLAMYKPGAPTTSPGRERALYGASFGTLSVADVAAAEESDVMQTRDVFIVHGREEGPRESVARFVARLGLNPIILHEQPDQGRTIIEKFEEHSADVRYAIVLLTADDRGGLADAKPSTYRPRARQNVILELGYFLGKLGRRRVSVIYEEAVEIPSDYQGVLYTPLDPGTAWRFKLAREMKAAGLDIDLNLAV